MHTGITLTERTLSLLTKLHLSLPFALAIPLLGIYLEDIPPNNMKIHMLLVTHCSMVCN